MKMPKFTVLIAITTAAAAGAVAQSTTSGTTTTTSGDNSCGTLGCGTAQGALNDENNRVPNIDAQVKQQTGGDEFAPPDKTPPDKDPPEHEKPDPNG
jgi:hypothetical protein